MIDENKKGIRAVKRKIKPRNPYTTMAHSKPGGPMKNKKYAAKNGFSKHKRSYTEDLETLLHNSLNEYQDRMAGVGMGDYRPTEEYNGGGEYNDETGMIKNDLHTIVRSSVELAKLLKSNENLPEWVQEKIAQVKGMIVSVTDYMSSQHEQGEVFHNTEMSDIEEGWGKAAILGTAAFIAAATGLNRLEVQHLMHSDPQLIKLAKFRERAIKIGDEYKIKELDNRIKQTLDHLAVTGDEIRSDTGKPVDPVYEAREMDDRLRAAQRNLAGIRRGEITKKPSSNTSVMKSREIRPSKEKKIDIEIKKSPKVVASGGGNPNPEMDKMIADFLAKGGEIKKGRPGKAPPVGRNQASLHIGGAGSIKRKGDKPGKGANFKGKPVVSVEEWTHDSLANKLFEQEITYQDQLNGMLRRKLRK